jgi:DNA repair exonuclease SbcCD ATPase subunit
VEIPTWVVVGWGLLTGVLAVAAGLMAGVFFRACDELEAMTKERDRATREARDNEQLALNRGDHVRELDAGYADLAAAYDQVEADLEASRKAHADLLATVEEARQDADDARLAAQQAWAEQKQALGHLDNARAEAAVAKQARDAARAERDKAWRDLEEYGARFQAAAAVLRGKVVAVPTPADPATIDGGEG